MATEALSSEETTVEAAITAVSGLSSYFSAVVALAVAAAAITAADVAAAADLHFYCGSFLTRSFLRFFSILFLPALLFFFELFKDFTFALHSVLFDAFFIYLVYVVTIYDKHISFFIIYAVNMHNVNQVTYYIEIYFKGFLWTRTACLHHSMK